MCIENLYLAQIEMKEWILTARTTGKLTQVQLGEWGHEGKCFGLGEWPA
jgi:hypothetical protein